MQGDAKPQINETTDILKSVAYFFAFLYFFLTLAHFFLLHESYKWILVTAALFTAIISLVFGLNAAQISSARQSLFNLLLLLFGSSNSMLHLWFSAAPEQTTNIFVAIIASGIVLSNRPLWIISMLFNWIGWITISFTLELALIQHFFFAMAMSTLLSWFAHLARKNLVEKQREPLLERDIALQHEQEAMAAAEAKSAFLANMSHEIRTPMNGVIGMIELVSRTTLDKQQQDFIATAKRSADSLMVIINDILDFSKIEVGELTIEQMEFDLEQYLTELIHDQQFLATQKGLQLALVQESIQQANVVGDTYRLTQIMNNLLSNAIKFSQSGTITVRYKLLKVDTRLRLDVEVSDCGIGISEAALPYLFDAFSQADTSTTRKFGGTGLGLAITKQLCKLMGGDITVKSQFGEGSTFKFSILLAPPNPKSIKQEKPQIFQSFAKMRVLLVEDNMINQELMLAIFNELKINAKVVNDGLEALSKLIDLPADSFDLILMDCQMPNLDGYETTRRIRAGDAGELLRHIPIVALTANVLDNEREKCLNAGMSDYLSKPIELNALKAVLTKYQVL